MPSEDLERCPICWSEGQYHSPRPVDTSVARDPHDNRVHRCKLCKWIGFVLKETAEESRKRRRQEIVHHRQNQRDAALQESEGLLDAVQRRIRMKADPTLQNLRQKAAEARAKRAKEWLPNHLNQKHALRPSIANKHHTAIRTANFFALLAAIA